MSDESSDSEVELQKVPEHESMLKVKVGELQLVARVRTESWMGGGGWGGLHE
jgi:hypothetical protein